MDDNELKFRLFQILADRDREMSIATSGRDKPSAEAVANDVMAVMKILYPLRTVG